MDLRVFVEPQQGADYDRVAALARTAERLGFDGFFSSDHYLAMGGVDGRPGPLDTWTTLAGLARETTTLRLGPLVTPVTFRRPGPLAIAAAQVDAMSAGRLDMALGAGWYQEEHDAYGIPFPATATRLELLEEYLTILTGLWSTPEGDRFSYEGRHHRLVDSPALPKPRQRPRPPIIVGGYGPHRTPQLAARFADEFNVPFAPGPTYAAQRDRVRARCEEIGRDPASMRWSVALVLCCGADDGEVARRARAIGRDPAELRANGAAGTPAEVVDRISSYAELGVTRVYLQTLDIDDHEHLELVAGEVAPHC